MKKFISTILILALLGVAGYYGYENYILPEKNYTDAKKLADVNNYPDAFTMFQQLDGYKDSTKMMMSLYGNIVSAGRHHTVGVNKDGTVVATGRNFGFG